MRGWEGVLEGVGEGGMGSGIEWWEGMRDSGFSRMEGLCGKGCVERVVVERHADWGLGLFEWRLVTDINIVPS